MGLKRALAACVFCLTAAGLGATAAAEFPSDQPIRLVNPYGAGGAVDVTARILASVAGEFLDTRLDVISMPGAGGQEAISFVKNSEPDGYTLLITDYGPLITTALTEEVDYELDEWVPLVQATEVVPIFWTLTDGPVASVEEWIEHAKANPGGLSIAHGRHLSVPHLPLILFEQLAGIENTHLPTTGGAEALAFVLGGQVDLGATVTSTVQGAVEAGQAQPLAVASAERVSALPDTPTLRELGYDVVMPAWYTIFAHRDVPEERRRILEEKLIEAYNSPAAQGLAQRTGIEVVPHGMEASAEAYERTIASLRRILESIEQ